ncbi:MAG TPA: hypothetical protein VEN82_06200 [Actinomycetota bacterium]|nr:hypothetical protein [Actinomycetota bacterium]
MASTIRGRYGELPGFLPPLELALGCLALSFGLALSLLEFALGSLSLSLSLLLPDLQFPSSLLAILLGLLLEILELALGLALALLGLGWLGHGALGRCHLVLPPVRTRTRLRHGSPPGYLRRSATSTPSRIGRIVAR